MSVGLCRAHILQRLIHHFERIDRIGSFARLVNGGVNNPLGERLLAALHHGGNQPGHRGAAVAGVDLFLFLVGSTTTRHWEVKSLGLRVERLFLFRALVGRGFAGGFRAFCAVLGTAPAASIHA